MRHHHEQDDVTVREIPRCRYAAVGWLALALFLGPPPARSAGVEDFYKGKTVRIVVGFSPGGGYDQYARLVARHIGRHIPGNPTVVVQNMPGAGSLRAANYLYNVAPKDGTAIGMIANAFPAMQAVGISGVQFDADGIPSGLDSAVIADIFARRATERRKLRANPGS